ncbi:PHP domain-containing protein [Nocardioides rotundus]|uniref:PHP domain-containing protein n=1 Tax=Nocardioides rotundus TaxID=1774216 RepID=UPI001CBF5FFC|nr:PHP domain-containing protein [Nocardioides rotundus]UAL29293.1 PHP domain-containing protein [Nocardioides rotundus]
MSRHHDDLPPIDIDQFRAETEPELTAMGTSRRSILAAGAALVAAGSTGLPADRASAVPRVPAGDPARLDWLVGDHHVHTQYSHDAKYTIRQQLDHAQEYGVDWLAFTEHSNFAHADKGLASSLEEIRAQRARRSMLIFQGIEWYIPAAEHATVLVAPGPEAANVLRQFELAWDGKLNGWERANPGSPEAREWEAKAAAAIAWLGDQRRRGIVDDALILANHPMRLGIDSPHELRTWRDADPAVMVGMEGAPGSQGSAISTYARPTDQRGEYTNAPRPDSHPAYAADMYRPYGGFDWMTATVGGMWDAMLAEGKPFWITSNSDNHLTVRDTYRIGDYPAGEPYASLPNEFDRWAVLGKRPDPVDTGVPQNGSDYWAGQFSRTHTGVTARSYTGVMDALRRGRVWVDHGHLLAGLDVRVRALQPGAGRGRGKGNGRGWGNASGGPGTTLGGRLRARRGQDVEVSVNVTTTDSPNFAGIVPGLAHVDVISGPITGKVSDRDTLRARQTRVVRQIDTTGRRGTFTVSHVFTDVQESFYLRLRGSDGNRNGPGYYGAPVDPAGPLRHGGDLGVADPWTDTWFYANPVFVDVT